MGASVAFGVVLTAIVEVSSVFESLNRPTLFASWIVADIGLLASYLKQRSRPSFVYSQIDSQQTEGVLPGWSWEAKLLTGASVALIATLFAIALLTPTTNGDSLSYHLARMAHWIDQGSVKHFATDDTRQLEFGPWSRFHVQPFSPLGQRSTAQPGAVVCDALECDWTDLDCGTTAGSQASA